MRLNPAADEEPDIDDLTRLSDGAISVARLSIPESQERTRKWAVVLVGGAFGFEIVFLLTAWVCGKPVSDLNQIGTLLVTPTVTLLGTALGFYFSSRT